MTRWWHGLGAVLLLGVVAHGCGVRYLPPPGPPQRVVPHVELEPEAPGEGQGRIVIDTAGEPARVVDLRMRPFSQALCITPCAVNLPLGPHELSLQSRSDPRRQSTGIVSVGTRPSVYQHALGLRDDHVASRTVAVVSWSLSLVSLMTGGILWGVFEATSGEDSSGATLGRSMVIGGGILGLVGAVFTLLGRPVEQEGTGVQWVPAGSPAPWRAAPQTGGVEALPPPP